MGLLRGIDRFEARSSLQTWIYRIVTNRAKTYGRREGRSVPMSALGTPDADPGEPAVDAQWFEQSGPLQGHWVSFPRSWDAVPEDRVLSQEVHACIRAAIAALAPRQREVMILRDIRGWAAQDVCYVLGLTETNQRMLLSRARSRVRRALSQYFDGGTAP